MSAFEFLVSLIRVPRRLTETQRAELEANCRHIDGRYWIFEGDDDALDTPITVLDRGITSGTHPDDVPPGEAIIRHAVDIFCLPGWPPEAAS